MASSSPRGSRTLLLGTAWPRSKAQRLHYKQHAGEIADAIRLGLHDIAWVSYYIVNRFRRLNSL